MLNPDFKEIISAFNAARVEYLVVGGYALAAHGLPRATGDIDLWVRPIPENAQRVVRALADFGAPLERVDVDDFSRPGMVVQFGVEPGRIDILTAIEGVAFDEAYPDRLIVRTDDVDLPVIGRQHLLRNKRAVGRPQDLADASRLEQAERPKKA